MVSGSNPPLAELPHKITSFAIPDVVVKRHPLAVTVS